MKLLRRYWGAFAVIAVFAGALGLSSYLLVRNSVVLWQAQRSSNWLASQLELEQLKSLGLLDAFYSQNPEITAETVRERFEIFESRINTIATGEEGSELRETTHYRTLMTLLTSTVERLQPHFDRLDRADRNQYLAIRKDLAGLGPPIHTWTMDFLLRNKALDMLRRSYYPVLGALLGVICAGIILIWMLNRAIARAEILAQTERAARGRADHANRAKDTFLAIASHEFRTPLNAIIGFSELLHDRGPTLTDEARTRFLEDILSSGRHLARIIDDTLTMSKISTGKLTLKLEPLDIRAIMNDCLSALRASAKEMDVALICHMPVNAIQVLADAVWLNQAIANIASNALRFTPSGECVEVKCHQQSDSVVLEVVDRGVGIPETELHHVTKAFYQVQNVLDRERGGLGLGLAIANGVIEAHGGNLMVSSVVGQGTVVSVSLPTLRSEEGGVHTRRAQIDLNQF
ncbi:MAG: HAMP domain-containing sensor histidine kinase [Dongiaceae bacterium]